MDFFDPFGEHDWAEYAPQEQSAESQQPYVDDTSRVEIVGNGSNFFHSESRLPGPDIVFSRHHEQQQQPVEKKQGKKDTFLEKRRLVMDAETASRGIEKRVATSRQISLSVKIALDIILDSAERGLLKLYPQEDDVIQALNQCDLELEDPVDPDVLISDSLKNGPYCTVLVQEVVPISIIMMLRAMDCEYAVEFAKDVFSKSRSFKFVGVEPFTIQDVQGAQEFHAREIVINTLEERGMNVESVFENMRGYMTKMGILNPFEIATGSWIDDRIEDVKQICKGSVSHVEVVSE